MTLPSDDSLVRDFKKGSKAAFEALFNKYKKPILNYVYRMLGNKALAEEIAQEAFMKAYIHLSKFKIGGSFQAWIYTIAGNLSKNAIRARKLRVAESLDKDISIGDDEVKLMDMVPDESNRPDLLAKKNEVEEKVQNAITMLEPDDRRVIILCDIQEKSYEEVSKILKVSVGTVSSRLFRARIKLAKILKLKKGMI